MKHIAGPQIIAKAIEFGADLCGLVSVEELIHSPSTERYENLGGWAGVGGPHANSSQNLHVGEVKWPDDGITMAVIAIKHPSNEPELDWWQDAAQPGGTKGNGDLIRILNQLSTWLEREKGINTKKIPYQINAGGIFLKDAAVLAGIGIIGRNNLLITPAFGPRVRLRALSLPIKLKSSGRMAFDPCRDCAEHCRLACPESAFVEKQDSSDSNGSENLPGRDGAYRRDKCHNQMLKNQNAGERLIVQVNSETKEVSRVHYCRKCEFACPVGRDF